MFQIAKGELRFETSELLITYQCYHLVSKYNMLKKSYKILQNGKNKKKIKHFRSTGSHVCHEIGTLHLSKTRATIF